MIKSLCRGPLLLASFELFVQKAITATWSDVEMFKLVEIWGEEEIQALLERCPCNKAVYEKTA